MSYSLLARIRTAPRSAAVAHGRTLATGTVFIRRLPAWAEAVTLERAVAPHAHVYGVWIGQGPRRQQTSDTPVRPAAVRITTEAVPAEMDAIAQLPDPTPDEIERCTSALLAVVRELGRQGICGVPVSKAPDMFQVGARHVLGLGAETRRFDLATTSTPRYSCGLVEGYRQGFIEARRKKYLHHVLDQSKKSNDELAYMSEIFERWQ